MWMSAHIPFRSIPSVIILLYQSSALLGSVNEQWMWEKCSVIVRFFLLFAKCSVQTRTTTIESKCCEPIWAHILGVSKNQFRCDNGESLKIEWVNSTQCHIEKWMERDNEIMLPSCLWPCLFYLNLPMCCGKMSIKWCACQYYMCFLWLTCESSSTLFAPPHTHVLCLHINFLSHGTHTWIRSITFKID